MTQTQPTRDQEIHVISDLFGVSIRRFGSYGGSIHIAYDELPALITELQALLPLDPAVVNDLKEIIRTGEVPTGPGSLMETAPLRRAVNE